MNLIEFIRLWQDYIKEKNGVLTKDRTCANIGLTKG